MNPWWQLLWVWLLAALMMTLGWQWQRTRSNAGIVDVLWAAGVGGSAVLLAALGSGSGWTRLTLAILGGAWGVRLAVHLWKRVRGEPEDGRYRHLRGHWHGDQWKFFAFFQFQAALIVLFALPFFAVSRNPDASGLWLPAGAAIWLLSVAGEAVADARHVRLVVASLQFLPEGDAGEREWLDTDNDSKRERWRGCGRRRVVRWKWWRMT